MTEVVKTKVRMVANEMGGQMFKAFCRWEDESEYEDFKDYEAFFKARFKEINMIGAKFICGHKKPFGFTFEIDDIRFIIYAKLKKGDVEVIVEKL